MCLIPGNTVYKLWLFKKNISVQDKQWVLSKEVCEEPKGCSQILLWFSVRTFKFPLDSNQKFYGIFISKAPLWDKNDFGSFFFQFVPRWARKGPISSFPSCCSLPAAFGALQGQSTWAKVSPEPRAGRAHPKGTAAHRDTCSRLNAPQAALGSHPWHSYIPSSLSNTWSRKCVILRVEGIFCICICIFIQCFHSELPCVLCVQGIEGLLDPLHIHSLGWSCGRQGISAE